MVTETSHGQHDPPATSDPILAALPADWALDADLPCPACRYNLRGLRTPQCVECGTEFHWQAILGISCPRCAEPLGACDAPNCPRCHLNLDWPHMLSSIDPAQFEQYEYSVRPIRAALAAWRKLVRPRHFWHDIPLERPPVESRLRSLGRAALLVFAFGLALVLCPVLIRSIGLGLGPFARVVAPLCEALGFCAILLFPPLITAVTLPRFTPTLSKFRIRRDQLLRIFVYGRAGGATAGLLLIFVTGAWVAYQFWMPVMIWLTGGGWSAQNVEPPFLLHSFSWDLRHLPKALLSWLSILDPATPGTSTSALASESLNAMIGLALVLVGWFWWWRYLWISLVDYLRLDRRNARALFVSTQAIALLCAMIILCNLPDYGFARMIATLFTPNLW